MLPSAGALLLFILTVTFEIAWLIKAELTDSVFPPAVALNFTGPTVLLVKFMVASPSPSVALSLLTIVAPLSTCHATATPERTLPLVSFNTTWPIF